MLDWHESMLIVGLSSLNTKAARAPVWWSEVSHEPAPSPFPLPLRGGEGARRAGEGAVHGPNACENRKGASHEPQKVTQASCLFGADRLEACPTLQPAPRFMAPTHVQFLGMFSSHEPGGARLRRALVSIR